MHFNESGDIKLVLWTVCIYLDTRLFMWHTVDVVAELNDSLYYYFETELILELFLLYQLYSYYLTLYRRLYI
jgi:hypothetical protein